MDMKVSEEVEKIVKEDSAFEGYSEEELNMLCYTLDNLANMILVRIKTAVK